MQVLHGTLFEDIILGRDFRVCADVRSEEKVTSVFPNPYNNHSYGCTQQPPAEETPFWLTGAWVKMQQIKEWINLCHKKFKTEQAEQTRGKHTC